MSVNYLFQSGSRRFPALAGAVMVASLLFLGCNREEVREYRVPKETAAAAPAPHDHKLPDGHPPMDAAMPGAQPELPKLKWTLPAGWTEKPPSTMRVASFVVAGADDQVAEVGVIPLPSGGNELDLVNMWRQQLQLAVVAQPEADTQSENVAVGGATGKLFEMVSDQPLIDGRRKVRILVVVLKRDATSWFFKMTGADELVSGQKATFVEFLKSVSFEKSPAAAAAPVMATTSAPVETNPALPQWQPPPDWQSQPPGQMVLASFTAGDEAGGKVAVNISMFPGDVGGLLANVNRWRAQVGLGGIGEAELAGSLTPLENDARLVDVTGTDLSDGEPKRLVGAIVPRPGQTWFYKLTGREKAVGRQKEAFIKFVQTVRYPDAP